MREMLLALLASGFTSWAWAARTKRRYGDAHFAMLMVIALVIAWGHKP